MECFIQLRRPHRFQKIWKSASLLRVSPLPLPEVVSVLVAVTARSARRQLTAVTSGLLTLAKSPFVNFGVMLQKLLDYVNRRTCKHLREYTDNNVSPQEYRSDMVTMSDAIPVGPWGEKEPHPHPKFAHRCQVIRRPVAVMFHCKTCGEIWITRGYDQKEAEPSLPGFSTPPL